MQPLAATLTPVAGEPFELPAAALTLSKSLASPAASLKATFPLDLWRGELTRIAVHRGTSLLFEGAVDQQRTSLSQSGLTLTLQARSKGALLLDNEAQPRVYSGANTAWIFNELIAPHGFVLVLPQARPPLAQFTVHKGQSLWDAFCQYARRVHAVDPWVDGDMVTVGSPQGSATFQLGGSDYPIAALEETLSPYELISQVRIRDDTGQYPVAVPNPDAQARGIQRTRYLIPAGEFVALPRLDAAQRILRSRRAHQKVTATLPGFLDLPLGQNVLINRPDVALPNLLVEEIAHTLDENGLRTVVTMGCSLYY